MSFDKIFDLTAGVYFYLYNSVYIYTFSLTLSLCSFRTSRGAHRVQQSHCSSISHRVLLTHALALSPSQFVHNSKSPRIYTSMHSAELELTKLIHTRLEDKLIRHRGDRPNIQILVGLRERMSSKIHVSGTTYIDFLLFEAQKILPHR